MEDQTGSSQEVQFVLRRLEESLKLFGREVDAHWFWIFVLVIVLAAGFFYVGWMYVRDSRSVGWKWSTFLAMLRGAVYTLLAAVFLLPAFQTWQRNELHSKVIMLADVSASMNNRDDLPSETVPVEKLATRQDKVIRFLTDERIGFIKRLQETNPITAYRFGGDLDDAFKLFSGGQSWTSSEWLEWLNPKTEEKESATLTEEARNSLEKQLALHRRLRGGTNLGEALVKLLNAEGSNMVQGIVVFSDGRNTSLSQDIVNDVKVRSQRAKIPIFTVGVGDFREAISIRIVDVQAPEQARPDDRFPVKVEVEGEGLPERELVVTLDVTNPKNETKPLDKPVKLSAGAGGTPRAQVEFEIDAAQFGIMSSVSKKMELEEGKWTFQARVPRDKREIFLGKEHKSEKQVVNVVNKPLRVLLFAGAATRDYQFLRSLLVREVDQHRVELSVCLQLQRPGVIQDVAAERFLPSFPYRLAGDGQARPEEVYLTLSSYDLIVAFDPDWNQLSPEQLAALEKWVNQQAGGLVLVAGPVNTYEAARLANRDKLKPLLDILPVNLQDSRLEGLGFERPTTDPWRLNFPGATAEMEFLKLDEESKDPLSGWDEFFTGKPKAEIDKDTPTVRGFYNYYPLEGVKPSATVIATFTDPRARLRDGNKEMPYFVTMPYGSGKVVYLGSGEMWRLRQYREAFLERFWTKMCRYAGSGNLSRVTRHGNIYMSSTFQAGQFARLEAPLYGRDLQPLAKNARPVAVVTPPAGVTMPTKVELAAKPSQSGDWQGWFEGRFRVLHPGQYSLTLQVPESGENLTKKFTVVDANPEIDNRKPDFAFLYQLASEVTDFMPRMEKEVQAEVRLALEGSAARLAGSPGAVEGFRRGSGREKKASGVEDKDQPTDSKDIPRFFFDLTTAGVIPKCMVAESRVQRNRGEVKDLWDKGFVVSSDPQISMATVLLIVAGLLSLEWLTRKLLKLA